MLEELERLQANPRLHELLAHYAQLGAENREIWHGRLMEMEGVKPPELTKLHGELIAFGWIEQNTGQVPICYRITSAGVRGFREFNRQEKEEITAITDDERQAA